MKLKAIFSAIIVSGLFLTSCDEDLFDVKESFTFEHEFVVLTEDAQYADQALVNLAEQETLIADYGSKIKDIEIVHVKYWFKNHNGSTTQQIDQAMLQVATPAGADVQTIAQVENINLAANVNNPQMLQLNDQARQKLEDLILAQPHTFMLKFAASFSEVPADFTVVFEFKANMTANPIK